jgi:hypothetical protein
LRKEFTLGPRVQAALVLMEISCPSNTVEISPSPLPMGNMVRKYNKQGIVSRAHDHRRNDLSHKSVELKNWN